MKKKGEKKKKRGEKQETSSAATLDGYLIHNKANYNVFFQLFVMVKQNRYNDRMKWYKLIRIGAHTT
jgi:hypothetical protein